METFVLCCTCRSSVLLSCPGLAFLLPSAWHPATAGAWIWSQLAGCDSLLCRSPAPQPKLLVNPPGLTLLFCEVGTLIVIPILSELNE